MQGSGEGSSCLLETNELGGIKAMKSRRGLRLTRLGEEMEARTRMLRHVRRDTFATFAIAIL
jgi:hypothetical protein